MGPPGGIWGLWEEVEVSPWSRRGNRPKDFLRVSQPGSWDGKAAAGGGQRGRARVKLPAGPSPLAPPR